LTKRTVGDQDNVDVVDSFEFQDLQDQLNDALNNINELNSEIETLTNNHAIEIETLTTQASNDATDATNALNDAEATIAALESDKEEISQSLTNLENIIIEIDDEDSEANIITLINEYDTNKGDVVQSLTNIVTNLSAIDTELIANADLEAQVQDLTIKLEDANNLIAFQQGVIADKDQQIINLANEVNRLEDKLSEANLEITRLKNEVQKLTNELSIAQSQIDNLKIINEQLNLLIESGEFVIEANQDTISDLRIRLEQALHLIESQESTIEDQAGQILSLNDIIDEAKIKIELLESQLASQQSESESNTQELQEEIDRLTAINIALQGKLDLANQQIETLEATVAANAEYNILLAEFNKLQDKYTDLETLYNDLQIDYAELQSVNDGITQADVDAAFEAGVASVDVSNIISEHQQLNGSVVGEQLLNNGNFRDPVNEWVTDDWVFQNGLAISDHRLSNSPKGLSQSVDLKAGRHFLNVNIHELRNCSLEVLFISVKDDKVVARTKIDLVVKGTELINLTQDCDLIRILVHKREGEKHFVSIDEISLTKFVNNGSITAKLILELLAYINQVDARNQNLQKTVLEQRSVIEGLQSELEQAKKDIVEYVLLLGNANNNILTLADVIIDVVSDLGISTTATAEDVVNLTNTFNSDQFNLNEAISSQSNLVNSLTSLLNEVDGGSTPSNPNNEKWLLTISGGFPIVTGGDLFLQTSVGNQSLIIKNPNIPDLNPTSSSPYAQGNFLENPGFTITSGFSDSSIFRDGGYLDGGIHQDKDPEYIVVNDLNNISNRVNYDANLERWIDGEFYDGNPNTFYTTFYSPQAEKSFTIKFTLHNFNPRLALVNANGEPWNGSGDKILGNRGNQRPIVTSTSYLENLGVTDGLQIEIEFLGGETGWQLYKQDSFTNSLHPINSLTSIPLIVDNTYNWNFNVSKTNDSEYALPGGANTILHAEKIQQASSSSSRMASDGVESFVNALTLPSYDGQDLNSESYIYPSSGSDIIMNKSQDIEPDLSGNILGPKRISKNKI
jgi:predicted  nucleic acid-binding Zn-ribbon protein